jgi:hypothetical protein
MNSVGGLLLRRRAGFVSGSCAGAALFPPQTGTVEPTAMCTRSIAALTSRLCRAAAHACPAALRHAQLRQRLAARPEETSSILLTERHELGVLRPGAAGTVPSPSQPATVLPPQDPGKVLA